MSVLPPRRSFGLSVLCWAIIFSPVSFPRIIVAQESPKPAAETPEKKLRFSFRYQRWADVLEWFAEEADLALVIDAPPPGTFNYTDKKEYSPVEAIDLLNSVLITKGYTLIRRNKMLMAIDVKDGIPAGLVPRVKLDELDKRGKFEMVSVMFPLDGRDAKSVSDEIQPLLGPNGKSVALPQTKQLLVTDTGGIMRAIGIVIDSIPLPKKPQAKPTPKPVPPPKPVLAVYPIKTADPQAAMSVLSQLLPGAKIVLDSKTEQLSVFAIPSQQTAAKTMLDQMEANNAPDKRARLELYPIDEDKSSQLMSTLQLIVPAAQMRIDSNSGKLVAWANAAEHEKIKTTIDKLDPEKSPQETPQLEVYRLTDVNPETTLSLLQSLLPKARLTIDSESQSLIAVAVPTDQQAIQTLLEQLRPKTPRPDSPQLRFYPIEDLSSSNVASILSKLAPKAQVTTDSENKRLMIVASPKDHEVVASTIEQLQKVTPVTEKNKLALYPVTPAQRVRFQAIVNTVTSELPGIKIITDAEPGELAIWAKPSQHTVIAEVISQLKRDVPDDEKFQLISYAVTKADPNAILTVLQPIFPNTKITVDTKSSRLLVWTRPAEHKTIKSAIEQLDTDIPVDKQLKLKVYAVPDSDSSIAMTLLQELLPGVSLTHDATAKSIVARAKEKEHELIARTLAELQSGAEQGRQTTAVVYPAVFGNQNATEDFFSQTVPKARVAINTTTGKMAAWATPKDHETIKSIVEQMTGKQGADSGATVETYRIESAGVSNALEILTKVVPDARLSSSTDSKKLIAWAQPGDHAIIKQIVERLERDDSQLDGRELAVHDVTAVGASSAREILATAVPKISFVSGSDPDKLIAWASPEEHEAIRKVLAQLDAAKPAADSRILTVYPLAHITPDTAQEMLDDRLKKNADFLPDRAGRNLIVRATVEQHTAIKQSLDRIIKEFPKPTAPTTHVYRFRTADPSAAQTVLSTLVPAARIAVDENGRMLVATASPLDHEKIKATVDQMDRDDDLPEGTLEFYPLRNIEGGPALDIVESLIQAEGSTARVTREPRSNQLVVVADPETHAKIRAVIERLKSEPREMEVFQLEVTDPLTAELAIDRLFSDDDGFGESSPTVDSDNVTQKLFVRATKEQLTQIRTLLAKMGEPNMAAAQSSSGNRKLRVIPFKGDARSTLEQIERLWPSIRKNKLQIFSTSSSRRFRIRTGKPSGEREQPPPIDSPKGKTPKKHPKRPADDSVLLDPGDSIFEVSVRDSVESSQPAEEVVKSNPETQNSNQQPEKQPVTKNSANGQNKKAAGSKKTGQESKPPVIVVSDDDSITISSDDVEALDQLEALLRAVSRRVSGPGRNFTVYSLRNAGAAAVAGLLDQIFRSDGAGSRGTTGTVTVVPDERLNALIVYANPADRSTVESLLEVLDSADIPDLQSVNRAKLIPIKNTDAYRVERVIRAIYKSQMTTGGSRRSVSIPKGIPAELATVLREINAATAAPLLTVEVDETTNSLVVMAPVKILDDVSDLVERLDEAAVVNSARGVTIVPLRKTNSDRVRKVLDLLLRNSKSSRRDR